MKMNKKELKKEIEKRELLEAQLRGYEQAEQHFKKKIEKAIERINEEVDYTPCCEHGHKCKSDPVFGVVRFNKVKQILKKLGE